MTFIKASAAVIALLCLRVSALPSLYTPRDSSDQSMQTLMQSAFMKFLDEQHVDNKTFYALSGWKSIDFAGDKATDSSAANNLHLFETCDVLPDRSGKAASMSFSDKYIEFVQEVNKAMPTANKTGNKELKQAGADQVKACDISKFLTPALKEYVSSTGKKAASQSDKAFLAWAVTNYTPLTTANAECQAAKDKYFKLYDTIEGDAFALFSAESDNIRSLTTSPRTLSAGITMDVGSNNVEAEYTIPVLEGTLKGWQTGDGDPHFEWDSASMSTSSSNTTTSGGGGLSFIWEDVSGSGSGSNSKTTTISNMTVQTMKVTFSGLILMDVERGLWFDDYRVAEAIRTPADNVSAAAQAPFKKFFGTSSSPGPAAVYNDQALVAYKPSITMQFASTDAFNQFTQSQGSAGGCFLFICAGASSSKTSNVTQTDAKTKTVIATDDTDNGYIIGFVQKTFWSGDDSTSPSTGGGDDGGDDGSDGGDDGSDGGDDGSDDGDDGSDDGDDGSDDGDDGSDDGDDGSNDGSDDGDDGSDDGDDGSDDGDDGSDDGDDGSDDGDDGSDDGSDDGDDGSDDGDGDDGSDDGDDGSDDGSDDGDDGSDDGDDGSDDGSDDGDDNSDGSDDSDDSGNSDDSDDSDDSDNSDDNSDDSDNSNNSENSDDSDGSDNSNDSSKGSNDSTDDSDKSNNKSNNKSGKKSSKSGGSSSGKSSDSKRRRS